MIWIWVTSLRIFTKMQKIRRKTNMKIVKNDDNVFFKLRIA